MTQFLLSKDLSVKRQNNNGQTALMLATKSKTFTVVLALLKANAPVNTVDFQGKTALAYAFETGDKNLVELIKMYQLSQMGGR